MLFPSELPALRPPLLLGDGERSAQQGFVVISQADIQLFRPPLPGSAGSAGRVTRRRKEFLLAPGLNQGP